MGNRAVASSQSRAGAGEGSLEGCISIAEEGFLTEKTSLPWVCRLQSGSSTGDPVDQAGEWLESRLRCYGAVLLRGLPIRDADGFEKALRQIAAALGDDVTGTSRRAVVHGRIYQSSQLEPHHVLDMHNEATYKIKPPRRLYFCSCATAPDGGETPIADSHRVFDRIDPEIRREFIRKGVMYIRHLDERTSGLIQSWPASFETEDRSLVESVCESNDIRFEWYGEKGLKLTEVRPAAVIHPVTGRWSWVNQIQLSHRSRWIRTGVLPDSLPDSSYPTAVYYGDGAEISLEAVGHIRRCWQREEQIFHWQDGDILALDNLWVAHGRKPYCGPRKLLLALSS